MRVDDSLTQPVLKERFQCSAIYGLLNVHYVAIAF